jgi:segregation and condensation protein A
MSGEQPQSDETKLTSVPKDGADGDAGDPSDPFDAPGPDRKDYNLGGFVVDLEGFEGPLDLLLTLARQQKVDLMNISILALAEQYLGYIEAARRIRLEIAADYLVMAAWLAFLKSRMLLPTPEGEEEPSGEELAARLQHQLRRLEAMREAAETLMDRKRLGLDTFPRGMPEGVRVVRDSTYECELYELLNAYSAQVGKNNVTTFKLRPVTIHSVEEAIKRLRNLLGHVPDWSSLETFLPPEFDQRTGVERRSGLASTFAASLELAKQGQIAMKQGKTFGPIFMRGQQSDGG